MNVTPELLRCLEEIRNEAQVIADIKAAPKDFEPFEISEAVTTYTEEFNDKVRDNNVDGDVLETMVEMDYGITKNDINYLKTLGEG